MPATQHKAPPLALMGLEPVRALLDLVHAKLARRDHLPRGNGEPILVIPGLATNALATSLLRSQLQELGYRAEDWGLGVNTGPKEEDLHEWLEPVLETLHKLVEEEGRKASLVGWSLGGIAARELSKMAPKLVSKVITLGTPFAGLEDATNAGIAYELLNGGRKAEVSPALSARLLKEPPVPTVSVYSKSDGVVSWTACVQPNARRTQHIEVEGVSHFGMVLNPKVFDVVAHELSGAPRARYVRGVVAA